MIVTSYNITFQFENIAEINNGTYTEEWKQNRKFVLHAMRQFGYGSVGLDDKIHEEISTLMSTYTKMEEEAFNPRDHLGRAMANLIFSILINETYDYNSEALQEKLDVIAEWQGTVARANILDIFPVLRFVPFRPLKELKKVCTLMTY